MVLVPHAFAPSLSATLLDQTSPGLDRSAGIHLEAGPPVSVPYFINETGLPANQSGAVNWSVTVNQHLYSSGGAKSILLTLPESPSSVNVTPKAGFVPAFYNRSVDPNGPNLNLTVPWHPFLLNASFDEIGLPQGKTWAVDFAGTVNRTAGTTLDFEAQNGSYAFSVTAPAGFQPNVAAGSVHLQGHDEVQRITFSPILYALTFEEAGLPTGETWAVEAHGLNQTSNTTIISFQVPDGNLSYQVLPIPGFHASIYSGNVSVVGITIQLFVNWTQVTYPFEFSETGLPSGSVWSVSVIGGPTLSTTHPYVTAYLPNGTYSFALGALAGFHGTPASGTMDIRGLPGQLSVQFTPQTYDLNISEEGLPAGDPWGVTMDGTDWPSHGPSLNLTLGNGTWSWVIQAVPGFRGAPASGVVTVQGFPQAIQVRFQVVTYSVMVVEQGLPAGKNWGIFLAGTPYTSQDSTLFLTLPNGTYSLDVGPTAGYVGTAVPTNTLTVNGSSSIISVTYNPTTAPAGHAGLNAMGSWEGVSILLFLVVLALALVAFLVRRHQSRRRG